MIGVGKDKGDKFKKLEFLDGEEDEDENEDGNIPHTSYRPIWQQGQTRYRDIVQFVPFR